MGDEAVPPGSILFRDRITTISEIRRLARDEYDEGAIAELGLREIPLLFPSQHHADAWLATMKARLPTLQTQWLPSTLVDDVPPEQVRARERARQRDAAEAEADLMANRRREADTELDRRRRAAEGLPVARVVQPTRTGRRRDQPLPTITEGGVCVQDEVMAFIDRRKAIGIERYGTVLQPHNGRDALRDAFEEAVDLTQYLAQALIERDGKLPGG